MLGHREYQEKLFAISPPTRRTIVAPPADRFWLAVIALGCLMGALVLLAVLVVG